MARLEVKKMLQTYEKPNADLIYYRPAEAVMDQDANPSITDGGEDLED